ESICLTFYSLTMHLMDYAGYQNNKQLKRPIFWQQVLPPYKVTSNRLNLREQPDSSTTSYLRFKPGALFTVTNEAKNKWHKVDKILTPLPDAADNYSVLTEKTKKAPQGWISVNRRETQAVNIYRV